jgi:hypothetical protein
VIEFLREKCFDCMLLVERAGQDVIFMEIGRSEGIGGPWEFGSMHF